MLAMLKGKDAADIRIYRSSEKMTKQTQFLITSVHPVTYVINSCRILPF